MSDSSTDRTTVLIRALAHGGEGVGQATSESEDQRTWFVAGALPEEEVVVALERDAKRFRRGRVLEVLTPSRDRVDPPCELAGTCGGCNWQHVSPAAQAGLKHGIALNQLRNVPGVDDPGVVASETVTRGDALGYRRRARLHYATVDGTKVLGFHRHASRELVDVVACPVLDGPLARALQAARSLLAVLPEHGEILALSDGMRCVLGLVGVRETDAVVTACEGLLDEVVVGLEGRGGRARFTVGEARLSVDGSGGVPLSLGAFDFAQANAAVNEELIRHVLTMAAPRGKRLLELYAGRGNFSRTLSREAQRVFTVESDRDAVTTLQALAERWQLPIKARHGDAPRLLGKLAKNQTRYDVVVVDPPRRGLGVQASRDLAKVAADRLVYVSCDPATLARDLTVLCENGLRLVHLRVFDMMPMTSELEVVATLDRGP